jgi:hypothetical protein
MLGQSLRLMSLESFTSTLTRKSASSTRATFVREAHIDEIAATCFHHPPTAGATPPRHVVRVLRPRRCRPFCANLANDSHWRRTGLAWAMPAPKRPHFVLYSPFGSHKVACRHDAFCQGRLAARPLVLEASDMSADLANSNRVVRSVIRHHFLDSAFRASAKSTLPATKCCTRL